MQGGKSEPTFPAKKAADETLSQGQQATQEAQQQARRNADQGAQATADVLRLGQQGAQQAAEAGKAQTEQLGAALSASMSTYQELAEQSRDGLERVVQSNAQITRALQEMGWETVRFTQESLRSGLRTATEVARCRSVEDIAELQREYLRESMDQFFDNSARILRIGSDAAAHAVDALRGRGNA